ncbi:ATP-dependent zinc metalloprotease YME1L-like isoform X2 [Schistocerca gregaria]|uniref:ATP-dependent zinc metalloprotease YME1L-like isoform X2 n=1 Tax=Schistocerca gregaria TaxID=7010 RepID=UPI00211DF0BA|nr:ATP-dependent zinc metalloprotease YME1L-like isoform X2 [Schistocerca gregaria]
MVIIHLQSQGFWNLSEVPGAFSVRKIQNIETKSSHKGIHTPSGIATRICSESFNEVHKNCSESILKNFLSLKISLIDGSSKIKSKNLSWRPSRTKSLPWLVSYKSADSSFENKHESFVDSFPICSNIAISAKFHRSLLQSCYYCCPLLGVSAAGFTTECSIQFEKTRNQNLILKLCNSLELNFPASSVHDGHIYRIADSEIEGLEDVSAAGFKTECSFQFEKPRNQNLILKLCDSLEPNLSASSTQDGHVYRLVDSQTEGWKGLTSDSLPPEKEQQRKKVDFAQSYLGENGESSPGQFMKLLEVIEKLLNIIVLVMVIACFAIFILLMGFGFWLDRLGSQREVDPEETRVTFEDVKGVDEAKQELKCLVEFLKNPGKFSALGAKLPKGILLVGPPGTGKTLLARAVAGEAGVPFFHSSGSEFDDILVGQGAARVRSLFRRAKTCAPCIIFIDEIDSIGAKRTSSNFHPYANQTINQLLSEMDGFDQNQGVIVLGATNRRDSLDKALIRPGRFDVEVTVPVPDYVGRKEILDLYLGRILSRDVDVEMLARGTTGFTGADLESMVNQAAIRAAIDGDDSVSMKHLEDERDKVLMGPERKSRIPDEETNTITAYHEGGHAIVAYYTKDSHPLHKVTIIRRGSSLGHTAYMPEKESYYVTKSQLMAVLDMLMGGRAAEELIFGPDKITSGASSDLKQATSIATSMVKEWGMSTTVGLRTYDNHDKLWVNELSPGTAELVDSEIKRLLMESYERAKSILKAHHSEHKLLAEALLKYETLNAEDIKEIIKSKDTASTSRSV